MVKVLAADYAGYEGVGMLYSRSSGKRRFVEVELMLAGTCTLDEIAALAAHMEGELTAELPELTFRVIPVSSTAPRPAAS